MPRGLLFPHQNLNKMTKGKVCYLITEDNEVVIHKDEIKPKLCSFYLNQKSSGYAYLKYSCNGLSVECYGTSRENNLVHGNRRDLDAQLIKKCLTSNE